MKSGAGESGKSTIIKQMRIIHTKGFEEDERIQVKAVIYSNVIMAFRVLLEIMNDHNIEFAKDATATHAEMIEHVDTDVSSDHAFRDPKIKEAMTELWMDAGVQKAVTKGHEFALNDNLQYFFSDLDRLFTPDWMPNDQDMLRARLKTTGITESVFDLKDLIFRMMDVGGQRSERKKWIHCFEGVHCLMFMASLSGYDQALIEDVNANQMHEALMLFETLVNGEWFEEKPIILFLNKIDLFRAKLKVSPIANHFPDYTGGDDEEKAKKFFENRFRRLNKNAQREIYVHFTNATDTNLLKATMVSVQDILIQKALNRLMF